MHTGCMRFRLMLDIHRKCMLRWSQSDKTYMIASDWRKMKQVTGEYSVKFPTEPKFDAMQYDRYDEDGRIVGTFTAALVMK